MMHTQVVGVAPFAPGPLSAVRTGNGSSRRYVLTWQDNSKNETAFVIERRVAGSTTAWTTVARVPSANFGAVPFNHSTTGPGVGTRTYDDRIGNTNTLYEYQVYAINVVGDVWNYSNPAFNQIPPGGGWPTLTLDSRNGATSTIAAPTNLTASAVRRNNKTATVTLRWTDNSANETGFLIQRADNAGFSVGVTNATVAGNLGVFTQDVARGRTFYYRVLAFNDTVQSAWSTTATITTP